MNYSIEMYLMFDIKLGIQLKSGYLYEEANYSSGFSYYLIQPSIDQYLPDDNESERSSSRFSDEAPLIYLNVIIPIGLISLIILKTRKYY